MEQPFLLSARKYNRLLLAFVGAFWLSIGVASALYLAGKPATTEVAD